MTHILKTRAGQSGILPQYYGTVNTNKGTGHIFDIIFDFDGNISTSLNCLLQDAYFLKTHYYGLKNALIGLRETLFKFNSEEERWYRFIPTNVSDGLVYHVKDNIYYRFTFDNQWEAINVVNITLIEYEMYFDTDTNQIWRYNNANWSLLNNNNYYIDTNMDNIWKYNNDTNQWDISKPVKISSISSNKVYFDQNNNSIKFKCDFADFLISKLPNPLP